MFHILHLATYLRKALLSKVFWQVAFTLFLLGSCLYLVHQQQIELKNIVHELAQARPDAVGWGLLVSLVFVWLQGMMYVHGFKAVGRPLPVSTAVELYFKRNFVSVFLPAGGFSSLVFFTDLLKPFRVTAVQNYVASYLYGLAGILTVIVVAVPTLLFLAVRQGSVGANELLPFVSLLGLAALLWFLARSVIRKGIVYAWLLRIKPDLSLLLDDVQQQSFDRGHFWKLNAYSLGIEWVGMVHVYIALWAVGLEPTWAASVVSYVIMIMLLVASPFLRGMGAIELSMTYVLVQFGYPTVAAAAATLLFRFFEFWLPLLGGALTLLPDAWKKLIK